MALPDQLRPHLSPRNQALTVRGRLPAAVRRAVEAEAHRALVRTARSQGEGTVSTVKVRELASAAREATLSQAMLDQLRDVLARGDLLVADRLSFFADLYRLAAGEVLSDLCDSYCRESRQI